MRRRTSSRVRTPVDGARLRTPVKLLHELDFLSAFLLRGTLRLVLCLLRLTIPIND